jgi:arylsulfatase A-like enzyme
MMNRRHFLRATGAGTLALAAQGAWAGPAERTPNVVFILADDIGYGDLGCYGAVKVKTPNIDRLSARGMRFTDAHSPSSMCSPTRYAILTGQYAWRHPPVTRGVLSGVSPLAIPLGRLTLPALLRQAGYATACIGKWHLGLGQAGETDYNGDIKPGPLEVGFDYAFIYPATNDRVPCVYVEDHRVAGLDPADPIRVSYGEPVGDEPTGRAAPELLKLKPSHGHDNTIINGISRIGYMSGGKTARWKDEQMTDTLTAKAVAFIERSKDKPFFLYFAPPDVHVPRTPNERFRGTSQCGIRGDAIHEFDWSVGEIAAALDRLAIADNTLVIVTSDNGGVVDDGYADGSVEDTKGHACNGVLRGGKGGLYEGGHRVPLVARWPARIKGGGTSAELVSLVDMLATCGAIVGRELPADAGHDSFNVLSAILEQEPPKPKREHLVMHSGGGGLAIRKGHWKLIPGKVPELYDLAGDLRETTNVAARHPQVVEDLTALLERVRREDRSRP